jgi:hypothetical protein
MTKEELLTDLKATYGELFPYRDPDKIKLDDATLALGVLLYRKIEMVEKTRVISPAFAEGAEPGPSVRPSGRKGSTHAD